MFVFKGLFVAWRDVHMLGCHQNRCPHDMGLSDCVGLHDAVRQDSNPLPKEIVETKLVVFDIHKLCIKTTIIVCCNTEDSFFCGWYSTAKWPSEVHISQSCPRLSRHQCLDCNSPMYYYVINFCLQDCIEFKQCQKPLKTMPKPCQ